ncbi:trans-sialidase, putative, partial [Trypanosoma cruzi marinkellei]
MGVRLDGNGENKFLELSYDKEKKWQVRCGAGKTEKHSSGWEPGKTHQVAIVLQDSSQGSVYVNGERVGTSCELKVMHSKGISHFYIGGDGGSAGSNEAVSVTVTNVLLYNRPLNENEIGVLNANKIYIPKLTDLKTVAARRSSSAVSRTRRSAENLAAGARGEGTAPDGGAHGDGSTVCGSGLLPLLLLLGLWGFVA